MSVRIRPLPLLLFLALAVAITAAACTSGDDPSPEPDTFDAGLAASYDRSTITTFVDGAEVARASFTDEPQRATLDGELVFHLLRLDSGEFLAVSARDAHSACWVHWSPEPPVTAQPGDAPGWFHDPCTGSVYDLLGTRVFGPAPHDLDRHPTELQGGNLHILLGDAQLIPGTVRVQFIDPNATPTPNAPGSPTATRGTPTPEASTTRAPEASTTRAPEASTTPVSEVTAIWTAADLLAALEAQDILVQPTGRTFACTEVNGLPGTEYDGDVRFTLWLYPTIEAAGSEWVLSTFGAVHPISACNRAPSRIYHVDNMVLWLPSGSDFVDAAFELPGIFLTLPGGILPSDIHQFALASPAGGAPFGGATFLDALAAQGFTFVPYEQPACSGGTSSGTLQAMDGPLGDPSVSVGFQLWVFPSIAGLEAEWVLGVDGQMGAPGVHHSSDPACDYRGGEIYHNVNLLLMLSSHVAEQSSEIHATILETFLALTP